MSRLDYNNSPLETTIIPNLIDGITNLSEALNYFNSLNIPTDFQYKSTLEQMHDELTSVKNGLDSDEKWLVESMTKIEKVESDFLQLAQLLPKSNIKVRNTTL